MSALTLFESRIGEVEEICRQYDVIELRLFGSGATDHWNAESSDLDVLVQYGEKYRQMHPLDSLVGVKLALEKLFGRSVDVVNVGSARNRTFISEALSHSRLIYAA